MLDVKQAAHKAFEYFASLYPACDPSKTLLEEVELTEDGEYWLITLSYPFPGLAEYPASGIAELFGRGAAPRDYKVFRIDAASGEVKSMKIRKVS